MFHTLAIGILDLPQYLWFTHNHGIDTRCHPEKMPHRIIAMINIKAFFHLLRRKIAKRKDNGL